MKTSISKKDGSIQKSGIKVRSSVKAGLDGSSKDAAYCRPSASSLNHNQSMKVRSGVKAGKTRHD